MMGAYDKALEYCFLDHSEIEEGRSIGVSLAVSCMACSALNISLAISLNNGR